MKIIKQRIQQIRRSTYLRTRKAIMSLSPDSVVENRSDDDIYIVINANRKDYEKNLHSIDILPSGKSTVDMGIRSPEAIILEKHLYIDDNGEIRTHNYTPVIKTPIGSLVTILPFDEGQNLVANFTTTPIGQKGKLIVLCGLKPTLRASKAFSNGHYIRPKDGSPIQHHYDRIAAFFPQWPEEQNND